MATTNRKFYDNSANQRADQLPWDLASDTALSCAAPSFDLRQQADRQRAYFSHLIDTCGGMASFCAAYGLNRDVVSDWVFQGKSLTDTEALSEYGRREVENTRKRLAYFQDEFDSLAANDPFWAQLKVAGAQRGK